MLTKADRLELIRSENLNTMDTLRFDKGRYDRFFAQAFFEQYNHNLGVRTYIQDDDRKPLTPIIWHSQDFVEIDEFCRKWNRDYGVLLTDVNGLWEGDSPRVFAARLIWYDMNRYEMEIARGQYTPRDIEKLPRSQIEVYEGTFVNQGLWNYPMDILPFIQSTYRKIDFVRPILWELSLFSKPVGTKRKPDIYWEFLPY